MSARCAKITYRFLVVVFSFLFCYIFTSASVGCLGLPETLSVKKNKVNKKEEEEKKRGGGGGE